jgi:hypothetical protein
VVNSIFASRHSLLGLPLLTFIRRVTHLDRIRSTTSALSLVPRTDALYCAA